jgi:hypothetical protein
MNLHANAAPSLKVVGIPRVMSGVVSDIPVM